MPALPDDAVDAALKDLPGWERQGKCLQRTLQFPGFPDLMIFVNRLAELAEEADHHPDLDIRYNRLVISLTSHDSGGITKRDLKMADAILGMEGPKSGGAPE